MKNKFNIQLVNRQEMPVKHILICEDDIYQQSRILDLLQRLLGSQGKTVISCVHGAIPAVAILEKTFVDLIILDHDMPYGDGPDLMKYLNRNNMKEIPVITFSGIPSNNEHLMDLGAQHGFTKEAVINGLANMLILDTINDN